jgi:hypothetical protein
MAGRKPDYRVVVPQDNGKGNRNYFRIGGAWSNENKDTGEKSIGVQINVGLPITLIPGQKLVLFENKDDSEERAEEQQF